MPRRPLQQDQQLYFLHIPKTAGSSLVDILFSQFRRERKHHYNLYDLVTPPVGLQRQRLIVGHTSYVLPHYLLRPPVCMTVLREPVAQVISHVQHILRNSEHPLHARFQGKSLLDILNTPEGISISTESQTLAIDGDFDLASFTRTLTPAQLRGFDPHVPLQAHMDAKEPDAAALRRRTLERLETFAFVGVTERFEESVELMTYTFGWEPVKRTVRLNVDPKPRKEIPQEVRDLLLERSPVDHAIYQYALERLERERKAMLSEQAQAEPESPSLLKQPLSWLKQRRSSS